MISHSRQRDYLGVSPKRMATMVMVLWSIVVVPQLVGAQETGLSGIATDTTELVLPGVTVTALHVESGNTLVSVTDATGRFRFGVLRPGVYTITCELSGFSTVIQEDLELLVGQRATLNVRMDPGTLEETITVTAATPLLDLAQSSLGGNIDRRQMEALPVNGRNWMALTMLAPGSRVNAINNTPVGDIGGAFQVSMDGQQVTGTQAGGAFGQPRFSRDAIAEFELVTSRFDATQGRSIGVIVNAVSKAGTNDYSGTVSGYFRDDKFIAKDLVADRVLPYSNQQISLTFGGPIREDKLHFFANYEGEREPQTFIFTSPWPRLNVPDINANLTNQMMGARVDAQLSTNTRLMVRGNHWRTKIPVTRPPGAANHASFLRSQEGRSTQAFASLIQTFGGSTVNEIKGGYSRINADNLPFVEDSPFVILRGYILGNVAFPILQHQYRLSVRDDLTTYRGNHELKIGGEFNLPTSWIFWASSKTGRIEAFLGPVPANVEELFPVWDDPSTWDLAALSPITRAYLQGFGRFEPHCAGSESCKRRKPEVGAWFQDNWTVSDNLTLNLGVRYDFALDNSNQELILPPIIPEKRPQDWANIAPRLGFAYAPNPRTVIRGGWGMYFLGVSPGWDTHASELNGVVAIVRTPNDGRPNFAADPYNIAGGGREPTIEEAFQAIRDLQPIRHGKMSYSYQSSIGFERQVGQNISFQADYVWIGGRRLPAQQEQMNINVSFDPATGLNFPFSDISTRPYPKFGMIPMRYSNSYSNYHALETAFTKRFAQNWQLSATYSLSGQWSYHAPWIQHGCAGPWNGLTMTCDTPFSLPSDFGDEYTLAGSDGGGGFNPADQRHRAVVNGIWEAPYGFQLTGLYFFGSGERRATSFGGDSRNRGSASQWLNRLRPDGTVVPRFSFVGDPVHRMDMRVSRRFRLGDFASVDLIAEVFNLFNHDNFGGYVLQESNPNFGQPIQDFNVAYRPRMLQLGFRVMY